jgi:NTP pyrophosphatase (non-canonical NTP hydrolase)
MPRTLEELIQIYRAVSSAFDDRERRGWGIEAVMIELSKQVGDLARAVMTAEEYYLTDRDEDPRYGGQDKRIGDELADILYCLIRIADHYGVDLEQAHLRARRKEWQYVRPGEAPPWEPLLPADRPAPEEQ